MQMGSALLLVFAGGAAIMVLEIAGARFFIPYFGGSFYVWVSQIGVIMSALAAGYYAGGWLADRFRRPRPLVWLLGVSGVFTLLIPDFSPQLLDMIVVRHPTDVPIPEVWKKLDPMLGSAVIFFMPCLVLASLSPFVIRLAALRVEGVGRLSGTVFSVSTVGSILGVFVSGYWLLDAFGLTAILRGTGAGVILLGMYCWWMDRGFAK